jgi:hypothetical protein
MVCAALDWKRTPDGMDYVPCDGTAAINCKITGLLLTVKVPLCSAHQKAFYKMGADVRSVSKKHGISMVHPRPRTKHMRSMR